MFSRVGFDRDEPAPGEPSLGPGLHYIVMHKPQERRLADTKEGSRSVLLGRVEHALHDLGVVEEKLAHRDGVGRPRRTSLAWRSPGYGRSVPSGPTPSRCPKP